jgi:hypothetical protein
MPQPPAHPGAQQYMHVPNAQNFLMHSLAHCYGMSIDTDISTTRWDTKCAVQKCRMLLRRWTCYQPFRELGTAPACSLTMLAFAPRRTNQPRMSPLSLRRFNQGFTRVQLDSDFSSHRVRVWLPTKHGQNILALPHVW